MKQVFVLLALCAFAVVGCGGDLSSEDKINIADHFNKYAFFVKHHGIGKCFVFHRHSDYYGLPFVEVGCTPAVEVFLVNKKPCDNQCHKSAGKLRPERMEQK